MTYRHCHSWEDRKPKGITLIELVMAMAIIALLVAIAYPSYVNQVRKSKRAVAKSALLDAANRQEQYFFTNRGYADAMNKLAGYTTSSSTTILFDENGSLTTASADAIYAVSVAAVDDNSACGGAPCFKLQAVPKNDQAKDTACSTFALTSSNAKTSADDKGTATSDCW